ncbi:STAS domain-containing protein [Shewanella cyperi]|uniref:STAS domain-containing protein n=1 Tax=Shewanella cyperi TaxID=2814292 RepID=UPI001A93CBAC|nr:STAS domain-containing protein [Shewanella cyperi]QSX40749.1 STAS domain-containing protein [Shewanella cyperi]
MSKDAIGFGSELTIRNIQDAHHLLSDKLHQNQPLVLDLSGLIKADTAGAQLLFLTYLHCQQQAIPLHWLGASPELAGQLAALGIMIPGLGSEQ